MYEAPHVVPEDDASKLRNVEEELKNNEYQPLTLDRDAKAPCKQDEIGGEKGGGFVFDELGWASLVWNILVKIWC